MNLKKIVGSTVDAMTLSYTERHLKEALEQEHGMPTTILNVIAEKSHNQYNIKAIVAFLDKAFKTDLREWKKYRNLVKVLDHLLKFGSSDMVASIKKYQSELRMLQNYTLTEGGVDRGAQIRESAAMICNLLSNFKELDEVREQSRKHREKFIGFSSNTCENPQKANNYGSDYAAKSFSSSSVPYSGTAYSLPQRESAYEYRHSQDPRIEENKKIASSLFAGFGEEESRYREPRKESGNYLRKEGNETYFQQESGNYLRNEGNETYFQQEGVSLGQEKQKAPDIFAMGQKRGEAPAGSLVKSEQRREEAKPPDIFAKVARNEGTGGRSNYTGTEKAYLQDAPQIRKTSEEYERSGNSKNTNTSFSTQDKSQKKIEGHYDIFEPRDKKKTIENSKL